MSIFLREMIQKASLILCLEKAFDQAISSSATPRTFDLVVIDNTGHFGTFQGAYMVL